MTRVLRGAAAVLLVLALGLGAAEAAIGVGLFAPERDLTRRERIVPEADAPLANLVHPYLGWSRRSGLTSPLASWAGRIPLFPDGRPTAWFERHRRSNGLG